MIKESYALTIDFGTQSVRAIIFNKKGDVLAMEKHVYNPAYFSTKPGYCEQHADYYYEKMCFCEWEYYFYFNINRWILLYPGHNIYKKIEYSQKSFRNL